MYNYTIAGESQLSLDLLKGIYDVNICSYRVNNTGKYPFIQFLLINDNKETKLDFPFLSNCVYSTRAEFIANIKQYLSNRLHYTNNVDQGIDFIGFYMYNNKLYVFLDFTECKLELYDIYSNNTNWLVLMDEIINHGHLCNNPINKQVYDFFRSNSDFCFLSNTSGLHYEVPTIGFVYKSENQLQFTYMFSNIKSNKNEILGPFYYFTNYYNAITDAKDNQLKNPDQPSGIVRFALFMENTKYFENHPEDEPDDSDIKQERLLDSTLDTNKEQLTMRISDHNGKWSNTYDSAYLGMVELDNDELLDHHIMVLKDLNQQIPVSYHYVDLKTEYSIL